MRASVSSSFRPQSFPQALFRSLPTSLQLHQLRCVFLISQSCASLRTSHTTITMTGLLDRLTEVLHDIISRPDADHTVMFVDNGTKGTRKSSSMTYSPRHDSMHGFHLTLNLQPPSSERSIGFRACEGLEYHAVRLGGRAHQTPRHSFSSRVPA